MYIVEDYNSGDMFGFKSIDSARKFMIQFYCEHLESFYHYAINEEPDKVLSGIAHDIECLQSERPYIEDVMYLREVEMMD